MGAGSGLIVKGAWGSVALNIGFVEEGNGDASPPAFGFLFLSV